MATHSSILAWRVPWTEEPGRLQSMGSQRVGHDLATNTTQPKQNLTIFQLCLSLSSFPKASVAPDSLKFLGRPLGFIYCWLSTQFSQGYRSVSNYPTLKILLHFSKFCFVFLLCSSLLILHFLQFQYSFEMITTILTRSP